MASRNHHDHFKGLKKKGRALKDVFKTDRLADHSELVIREILKEHRGLVLTDISNKEYHEGPGISSSDIKEVINGTLASWIAKKNSKSLPTESQIKGTAIHTYILERDKFWLRYCKESEYPQAPARNTKEGKEAYAKWQNDTGNTEAKLESDEWKVEYVKWAFPEFTKDIVTDKNLEMLKNIEASIQAHPDLSKLLSQGESEVSYYWIHPKYDLLCKARADKLNYDFPCIPDLKSCLDASPDAFEANISNYDYHVSAFWYLFGAKIVFGYDFENFVYVPIEKDAPHQVTLYPADEGSLSVAEGLCEAGLIIISDYVKTLNEGKTPWTGHSRVIKSLGVKPWAFNKLSQVIHKHDLQGRGLESFIG